MVTKLRRRTTPLVAVLFMLFGVAWAQGMLAEAVTTGIITGNLGGEETSWRTVELDSGEAQLHTSTLTVLMDILYTYTLQGHQDDQLVEGAVAISFVSYSAPLADCPCELTGEITYWTTTSAFRDLYTTAEATITVLEAEEVDVGVWRVVGTAEGQLDYFESLTTGEPTGEPMDVSLEFSVDRVVLQD
ncbi:MAG: hypothetical protein WDA03_06800 [Trueperaceae bacterium]